MTAKKKDYVLSMDPATLSGWALWTPEGKLIRSGRHNWRDFPAQKGWEDVYHIVHEKNFYGNHSIAFCQGLAVGTALTLARKNCKLIPYTSSHWRKVAYNGNPPKGRTALKQAAVARVRELFNIVVPNDDRAEAILIGYVYFQNKFAAAK